MEQYRLTICGSHLDGMCVTRGGPRFDITQHYTCHGSCSDDTQNNNSYLLPIFNLNLIEHRTRKYNHKCCLIEIGFKFVCDVVALSHEL